MPNSTIGRIVSHGPVKRWIVRRAMQTPYFHLDGYMCRWWLFNAYCDSEGNPIKRSWLMQRLPSIRVHHILRPDEDRHMHDHPWDAVSYILGGWYTEERETGWAAYYAGHRNTLKAEDFHRIADVSFGGVWTLFITWPKRNAWGFKVDGGTKIRHDVYLAGRDQA